ncbi:ATPase central domain-containing protein [Nostoc sp. NIES-2111]|nr:ATPase central domain-containing protein [Nostoc sp. NIES-2111]
MNATTVNHNWYEANERYLLAALGMVRDAIERYAHKTQSPESPAQQNRQQTLQTATAAMTAPPLIERVCQLFGLSQFERDILLMCACMEFYGDFAALCGLAQGDTQRAYPTLSLALAALPNPHWDAIAPDAKLRYWRLIELGEGRALTLSPLRIDERVLHYLIGRQYIDERLAGIIEPVPEAGELVHSQQQIAQQIASVWMQSSQTEKLPILQLCGVEPTSKRAIATTVCKMLSVNLHIMPVQVVPSAPAEMETLLRLWERESILSNSALLLDCDKIDITDLTRTHTIGRFLEHINGLVFLSSRERIAIQQRPIVSFDIHKPTIEEQSLLWQNSLAQIQPQLNGQVKKLATQFNLSPNTIRAACAEALGQITKEQEQDVGQILWDACRKQARPHLDELAQRIPPTSTWDDLVLPPAQAEMLREIAAHVRQRATVYQNWGFAAKNTRGLGISALFAGASGTGKTLAAEVLAQELHLDLYRIDLSSVVSKYIGETEKNLRRVFDAAEEGGVILLFDEADALFGKRSEVKDSHDRYANIEVSYLLQRMESYPGLAIMTTNLKSSIDTAFQRRIRFVVQFPFPDATQRAEIWRRVYPTNTPTNGLDAKKLSQLSVAGGNIRNIALNAAFLAADANEPVQMKHLLRAARTEYAKLEKSLTEAEIGGWV